MARYPDKRGPDNRGLTVPFSYLCMRGERVERVERGGGGVACKSNHRLFWSINRTTVISQIFGVLVFSVLSVHLFHT